MPEILLGELEISWRKFSFLCIKSQDNLKFVWIIPLVCACIIRTSCHWSCGLYKYNNVVTSSVFSKSCHCDEWMCWSQRGQIPFLMPDVTSRGLMSGYIPLFLKNICILIYLFFKCIWKKFYFFFIKKMNYSQLKVDFQLNFEWKQATV